MCIKKLLWRDALIKDWKKSSEKSSLSSGESFAREREREREREKLSDKKRAFSKQSRKVSKLINFREFLQLEPAWMDSQKFSA